MSNILTEQAGGPHLGPRINLEAQHGGMCLGAIPGLDDQLIQTISEFQIQKVILSQKRRFFKREICPTTSSLSHVCSRYTRMRAPHAQNQKWMFARHKLLTNKRGCKHRKPRFTLSSLAPQWVTGGNNGQDRWLPRNALLMSSKDKGRASNWVLDWQGSFISSKRRSSSVSFPTFTITFPLWLAIFLRGHLVRIATRRVVLNSEAQCDMKVQALIGEPDSLMDHRRGPFFRKNEACL